MTRSADYKDAAALKAECVQKGRYAIAVLPFNTAGSRVQTAQAATLQAYVTSALTDVNDPFIQVVDRDNIRIILDQQRMAMSGVVDESTAVSAGSLSGRAGRGDGHGHDVHGAAGQNEAQHQGRL